MDQVVQILKELGPSRASKISAELQTRFGLSATAARKRLSRVQPPLFRFPVPMLPKRESFLYLQDQRKSELFWTNLLTNLRDSNSVYGACIDGLMTRGGIVRSEEFSVISGAPLALRGQVSSERVAKTLESAGAIKRGNWAEFGECYMATRHEFGPVNTTDFRARELAEGVILDALREWARKMGLAAYNSITIRGDKPLRQVGQFNWDLSGPSYLLPLRRGKSKNGFLVADVFADGTLDVNSIQYFIRKVEMLRASSNSGDTLPILVAPSFTPKALTAGHAAGVVLASHNNLFGVTAGRAIHSLTETLRNAAAVATQDPERLTKLLNDLSGIEGAAGNLRGVLFELISAYLARLDAVSVDVGIVAMDSTTGKTAEIDVLKVRGKNSCVGIECKGKRPGGVVELDEVDDWLRRLPIFRSHLARETRFREATISFELWTSGSFSADALKRLRDEKPKRTKVPIDWKDGYQVADIAKHAKEKSVRDALFEHFLGHPLARTARSSTGKNDAAT